MVVAHDDGVVGRGGDGAESLGVLLEHLLLFLAQKELLFEQRVLQRQIPQSVAHPGLLIANT